MADTDTDTEIDTRIAQTERCINYSFANKLLCAEAIQMASAMECLPVNGTVHLVKKNRDLEAVGDTVIATILCAKWYNFQDERGTFRFHQVASSIDTTKGNRIPVGIWDAQIRQQNLTNVFLGRAGTAVGLDQCVIKQPSTFRVSHAMVANAVEAIIGAVYLDAGPNGLTAETALPPPPPSCRPWASLPTPSSRR
jgi:ribonuclease-3